MDTSAHHLPTPTSLPLAAAGDLPGHLQATIAVIGEDLPGLHDQLIWLLTLLDKHLAGNPLDGAATFLADPDTDDPREASALLRLAQQLGAELEVPEDVPAVDRKAPLGPIAQLTLRNAALTAAQTTPGSSMAVVALLAGIGRLEAGSVESCHVGGGGVYVEGTTNTVTRLVPLPAWTDMILELADRDSSNATDWWLHASRSDDPETRAAAVHMAVNSLLKDYELFAIATSTALPATAGANAYWAAGGGPEGVAAARRLLGHRTNRRTRNVLRLSRQRRDDR